MDPIWSQICFSLLHFSFLFISNFLVFLLVSEGSLTFCWNAWNARLLYPFLPNLHPSNLRIFVYTLLRTQSQKGKRNKDRPSSPGHLKSLEFNLKRMRSHWKAFIGRVLGRRVSQSPLQHDKSLGIHARERLGSDMTGSKDTNVEHRSNIDEKWWWPY